MNKSGKYVTNLSGDMEYKSFVPAALPTEIEMDDEMISLLVEANKQIYALESITAHIPSIKLFTSMYVRKEALMSSQIEGTQATQETEEIEETQEAEQPQKPALEEEKIVEEKPAETPVAEEEPIQTPVEEETSANQIEKTPRYKGKWSVYHLFTDAPGDSEETFYFELRASNGEKLLASEEYTSYNGALRGIETYKLNIARGNFKIAPSKKGDYIFKLLSGKNTLLCTGENYLNRASCENAIESTKRFAETAVLDKKLHEQLIKAPVEDDGAILPLPDGHNGKWVIESTKGAEGETLFYFVLYANNGEKLLTSEEYTTYVGAVNGISTHKKNIQAGNFKITLTKRGDYIYKLLNGNGQLLCLGEHYKTKRRCQSAVESVKRFALHSPMLTDASHTK